MIKKTLLSSRYQLHETVFAEYIRGDGIFFDVGPYSSDPSDMEIDLAIELLQSLKFYFLELAPKEWILHLEKLTAAIPEMKSDELTGQLTHLPAFLVRSIFFPHSCSGKPPGGDGQSTVFNDRL